VPTRRPAMDTDDGTKVARPSKKPPEREASLMGGTSLAFPSTVNGQPSKVEL
jgi:hypothetical protein